MGVLVLKNNNLLPYKMGGSIIHNILLPVYVLLENYIGLRRR